MSGARVIVADDDVLLREGVASLLERSGFEIAGQAGDGAELVALTRELVPDLVLVDIRMPPSHTTEGLEAARAIREELPQIGILLLSAHVELEHAMELLASGRRSGYILKSRVTQIDDFIDTVQRVAAGGRSSIRRWSRSWWARGAATIRSRSSRRASARCWS